jgi:thiamine-phosphate pyrophosphorylase
MARRKRLPTLFLMTDPRLGDALWPAIDRLPRGAGIVVRHHGLPQSARAALVRGIRARSRGRHLLLVAAPVPCGLVDGVHVPAFLRKRARKAGLSRPGIRTAAVHSRREMARAKSVDALFVSPVFATASHPGARTLGRFGLARLARAATVPVIAVGGMTAARFRRLKPLGAAGWAAIDALAPQEATP